MITSAEPQFASIDSIQVTQGRSWHPAMADDGEYFDWMHGHAELKRFNRGVQPTADSSLVRDPFDHRAKFVEITSPAVRILDSKGEPQFQCTRTMYEQVYALFAGNRSRSVAARHKKKERDYNLGNTDGWDLLSKKLSGITVWQGAPTDEEIADPVSETMRSAPLWVQVVTGIQHLRGESGWELRDTVNSIEDGGFHDNSHTMNTPVDFARPDGRRWKDAATVGLDGDVSELESCTVGVHVRNHRKLMTSLRDLLDVSVDQIDWPHAGDGKMWRVERS